MRKSKGQKNEESQQLKLFSWQAGELTETPSGGTGQRPLDRAELLSVLEKQRTLTENLIERIVDHGNLMRAYGQVAKNDGSSGIDEMEVNELRQWLGGNINILSEMLLTEKFEVSAVRKVEIQKPEGGKRMLGIPVQKSWNVVMYSQGWWNMSSKQAVNEAMNLAWFSLFGLQSLFLRMKV